MTLAIETRSLPDIEVENAEQPEYEHLIPMDPEVRKKVLMFLLFVIFCLMIKGHEKNYGQPVNLNSTPAPVVVSQPVIPYGITDDGQRFRGNAPEMTYEGMYYRRGELELNPQRFVTRANWWMMGEYGLNDKQGCFGDPVDGSRLVIATWFYPCGSTIKVTNPETGQWIVAEVTDRGPNRNLTKQGWENDRSREFGADISPAVAAAIGQQAGSVVIFEPINLSGATEASVGPIVDLTISPPNYIGIGPGGEFIISHG